MIARKRHQGQTLFRDQPDAGGFFERAQNAGFRRWGRAETSFLMISQPYFSCSHPFPARQPWGESIFFYVTLRRKALVISHIFSFSPCWSMNLLSRLTEYDHGTFV